MLPSNCQPAAWLLAMMMIAFQLPNKLDCIWAFSAIPQQLAKNVIVCAQNSTHHQLTVTALPNLTKVGTISLTPNRIGAVARSNQLEDDRLLVLLCWLHGKQWRGSRTHKLCI
jgi:hypothetical protein